jgi:hypothetical protein
LRLARRCTVPSASGVRARSNGTGSRWCSCSAHRIRVRATNLAERCFVKERRRSKVIGRFGDERSAMKLVLATLIRAAERWCRVSSATSKATSSRCCAPSSGSTPGEQPHEDQPRHERCRVITQAADIPDAQDLTAAIHLPCKRNSDSSAIWLPPRNESVLNASRTDVASHSGHNSWPSARSAYQRLSIAPVWLYSLAS